jgi:hypothetical protein
MLPIIQGLQSRTTLSYHLTPVRMAVLEKHKLSVHVEKLEPLYTVENAE